jgi:hypothetical protein
VVVVEVREACPLRSLSFLSESFQAVDSVRGSSLAVWWKGDWETVR